MTWTREIAPLTLSLLLVAACGQSGSLREDGPAPLDLLLEELPVVGTTPFPESVLAGGLLRLPLTERRFDPIDLRWCDPPHESVGRLWGKGGPGGLADPRTFQMVCAYSTSAAADARYRRTSPAEIFGEDWPNIEPGVNPQDLYGSMEASGQIAADESRLLCGLGSASHLCSVWVYWARYERYLVTLHYISSGGRSLRVSEFNRMIEAVDNDIASQLALSTD